MWFDQDGVDEKVCSMLAGTDRASANIAAAGLKGLIALHLLDVVCSSSF